jgi:hypothetical protein
MSYFDLMKRLVKETTQAFEDTLIVVMTQPDCDASYFCTLHKLAQKLGYPCGIRKIDNEPTLYYFVKLPKAEVVITLPSDDWMSPGLDSVKKIIEIEDFL